MVKLRKKALFNPNAHSKEFHEFILGSVIAGVFAGFGFFLGGALLRALVRKYLPADSFLSVGLPS